MQKAYLWCVSAILLGTKIKEPTAKHLLRRKQRINFLMAESMKKFNPDQHRAFVDYTETFAYEYKAIAKEPPAA